MKISNSIDDINREQWRNLAKKSPVSSFFQTEDCFRFYESLPFLKPFVFGVSEHSCLTGVICGYIVSEKGFLPHIFSKRAIVTGGLLLDEKISHQALQTLLSTASERLKKEAIYIEIRNYRDYSPFRNSIESSQFLYQPHYDIHVDLRTSDLVKNISESKQRQIKTALNKGVNWKEANDSEAIAAFYGILKNTYETRVRRPLFPLLFFERLAQSAYGKIIVTYDKNKNPIGGMAVVISQGIAYEWFVCGNDADKTNHASTLTTWAGLKYAEELGCSTFDFMGAGSPNKPYGVRDFKMKFGGDLHEFGRFVRVNNHFLYAIGKLAIAIANKTAVLGRLIF